MKIFKLDLNRVLIYVSFDYWIQFLKKFLYKLFPIVRGKVIDSLAISISKYILCDQQTTTIGYYSNNNHQINTIAL